MKRMTGLECRGDCLTPTDLRLLGNPLDFIAEDHLRERQICALIDRLAAVGPTTGRDLETVLPFLGEELECHIADEEAGLFPLMALRCAPEDDIGDILVRLRSDHVRIGAAAAGVRQTLQALRPGGGPDAGQRRALMQFAADIRRHLIVENAIILPIARVRLAEEDLDSLRLGMLRRRGLDRLLAAPL